MSFASQLDQAVDSQIEHAGESITISRNAQSVSKNGIWGTTGSQSDSVGEAALGSNEGSWIIRAADYCPEGTAVRPAIGDRIVRASDGAVFEVQRLDNGREHFDWYGGRRYALRVYVREIPE